VIPALALRHRLLPAAVLAVLLLPASAAAQAFTPPARVGSVTFAWQWIDNTGHIDSGGKILPFGKSVTTSVLAEVDYGLTERLAATVAVPFVFARYKGPNVPPSADGPDDCFCWHQSFQDFSIAGRYRFGDDFWGLTPHVRVIIPSHNYPYQGEAVVGPNLNQVLLGINGFWQLAAVLPKATIQAGYNFAVVEKAGDELRPNRSNLSMSFGYPLASSLYVHGGALLQKTHNGLPLFQARLDQQGDRLLKMWYWHLTGGLSYSVGSTDLFFAVEPYVWGRDTHNGIAYTVGASWNFVFLK
jgi:hypothetical protein